MFELMVGDKVVAVADTEEEAYYWAGVLWEPGCGGVAIFEADNARLVAVVDDTEWPESPVGPW